MKRITAAQIGSPLFFTFAGQLMGCRNSLTSCSRFQSKKSPSTKVISRYSMILTQFYVFLLVDAVTRISIARKQRFNEKNSPAYSLHDLRPLPSAGRRSGEAE